MIIKLIYLFLSSVIAQREPKDICPIRGETCTNHTAQGSEKVHSMVMSISASHRASLLDLES